MKTATVNTPSAQELIERLRALSAHDPHTVLGLHAYDRNNKVIRLWRPDASEIFLEIKGHTARANKIHDAGLFESIVPKSTEYSDYRVWHQNGLLGYDPYAFLPTFGEVDQYLFSNGVHYEIHKKMGARLINHQGCNGVAFTVWAPSAKQVSVVGDFNHWDGRKNPMRSLGSSGVWELFIPGLEAKEKYKFEITTQMGNVRLKADPFGLEYELRPKSASCVADVDSYEWNDAEWMQKRRSLGLNRPISIYELHLGSWKRKDGHFLNYRELAHELSGYCRELGYTHIELLPCVEHPLDESWGYQVTGFFAPTSRFGSPQDFQYFIDHLHQNNIGIILDWVPGHFPCDDHGLARFDGTALYEHEDPKQGYHPHWHTCIFNFGRKEVSNFLLASALYWLDVMHIDGLRVDAVASMLYLDYGREEGQWIPNCFGGKENLEAIEFLKHTNSIIHEKYPGVLTIAEESTAFTGVSHPLHFGGLGFDLKWNMGWMNDTLRYIEKDPIYRAWHHNDLTFGLLYAFSEKFVLVFSHDEVVHGKRSMLSKMPGDLWQKFANLRLLLSYQFCQPGKKLMFMGTEIAQWNEWNCKWQLDWNLLDYDTHRGIKTFVNELNHFYRREGALWEKDFDYHGFEWIDFHDTKNSVISYYRKGNKRDEALLCIHNFTPMYHHEYFIGARGINSLEEVFNSDDQRYGGSGKVKEPVHIHYDHSGYPCGVMLKISPLATMVFRVRFRT